MLTPSTLARPFAQLTETLWLSARVDDSPAVQVVTTVAETAIEDVRAAAWAVPHE